MSDMFMDTQVMPAFAMTDEMSTPPDTAIPVIQPIGGRDVLEEADEDTLKQKFDEYAEAAAIVVEHHEYEMGRFDAAYQNYVQIFTKLELLEEIRLTSEAIAPGFDIFEEFELIELPEAMAKINETAGKAFLYGGAVVAGLGLLRSAQQVRAASKVVKSTESTAVAAMKTAKRTRWLKRAGAVGAFLSVGTAAYGIVAHRENVKRSRASLVNNVESYQTWYDNTVQAVDEMALGSGQMEAAVDRLMELLGYSSVQELIQNLGGTVQAAGELEAVLKTATRMLCSDPPLSVAQVSQYTSLPEGTVARRKEMIVANPGICSTGVTN